MRSAYRLAKTLTLLAVLCVVGVDSCFADEATPADPLDRDEAAIVDTLPVVPSDLNRDFVMVRRPVQRVRTELMLSVTAPELMAETWLFASPIYPKTSGQEILKFATMPESESILTLSAAKQPIRRCRIEATNEGLKTSASFRVDAELALFARSLTRARNDTDAEPSEPLADRERRVFLRPNIECDYIDKEFQNWKSANSFERKSNEGEIRFAERVFKRIVDRYQYLYVPSQTRTASALCQTGKSDCGGLSTLFVATLRSEGIPARILSGRWAISAEKGETVDGQPYYQYHVIAEFYADGIGWVPVDVASAILHDKTPAKLEYFGRDAGNFVVFHVDAGVQFETELYGEYRAVYFQIPLFWVRGRGSLKNRSLQESWTVQTVYAVQARPNNPSRTNP